MKKINNFFFTGAVALMLVASASCTKEGPQGIAGKDGTNGTNGTDGTTTCVECHSSNQVIWTRENQWAASVHATGTAFARNTGECAVCHTSQGFRGNLDGSYDWTADGAMINNPNPQNCYTCHEIHQTYTAADLTLTIPSTGEIAMNNTTLTHDFGKGNLCATCHQARTLNPFPVVGGPDVAITNSHYGIHHGTQSNFLAGVGFGLFEVGTGLTNSVHGNSTNNPDACVTCHMADGTGTSTGGHTFNVGPTINQTGCKVSGCHDAGEDVAALAEDFQAQIQTLKDELQAKLFAAGVVTESGSPVVGTYSPLLVGAYIDLAALNDDKSMGVHNPKYTKKLLENLNAALN